MQGVVALSGAQCCVFGQLSRLRNADSPCAGLTCQRSRIVSTKQMKYDECKAGPLQYLRRPDWRCCASVSAEAGIATEEINPSITKETLIPAIEVSVPEGPTVKVKFVLQKKCQFGQNFKVVGNHPLFGSWNPEAALPMNWADGHLWSVEVDVPTGKPIEFKFVLTGENGETEWQPGSNLLLETVEDVSPLIVDGEWDSEDEDTAPVATEELSNVAGIGGLVETAKEEIIADSASIAGLVGVAKEEVTAGIDSNPGEVNGSPLSSNFSAVESSETDPQVLIANATPVSGAIQAAPAD